jgi:hypothetical protein
MKVQTSAECFPREPVTKARYLLSFPSFLFSSKTVEHEYFASNKAAASSISESIRLARLSTVCLYDESPLPRRERFRLDFCAVKVFVLGDSTSIYQGTGYDSVKRHLPPGPQDEKFIG